MKKIISALLLAIIIFAAAIGLIHSTGRMIVNRIRPCSMPCRWAPEKGYSACTPITANLEIKTTPEPNGQGQAVWYKATATNNSCEAIKLNSDFFASNQKYAAAIALGINSHILVLDAAGRPLPPDTNAAVTEQEIRPYVPDLSAVRPLITTEHLKSDPRISFDYLVLEPGKSASSSPSILKPYRLAYRTVETETYVGTMRGPESVDIKNPEKKYAAPPPGFRRLTEYKLARAGIYSAQLIINESAEVQHAKTSGPFFLQKLIRGLLYLSGPPGPDDYWGAQVNAKSEKIKFKVAG
jgi:hypothetical protein